MDEEQKVRGKNLLCIAKEQLNSRSTNQNTSLLSAQILVETLVDKLLQLNKRPSIILKYLQRDLGIRWRFVV